MYFGGEVILHQNKLPLFCKVRNKTENPLNKEGLDVISNDQNLQCTITERIIFLWHLSK